MGELPNQPREMIWQGRVGPWLSQFCIAALFLVVIGAVFYLAIGLAGVGNHPATIADRLFVALMPVATLGPLFAFVFGISPRRVRASREELVVDRWLFGRTRLHADRILGVRARSARRDDRVGSICVDVRGKRTPVVLLEIGAALQTDGAVVLAALTSLYGVSPIESGPLLAAASPEAAEMSQHETRWRARSYPRGLLLLDLVCPPAAIAGAVFWRQIWGYMIRADAQHSAVLLCTITVVGTFAILSLFDLLTGGPARELIVGSDGVTLRRRYRDLHVRAEDILGVRHLRFTNEQRAVSQSSVLLVCKGRWNLCLRENRFVVSTTGLLAGVLLHRFGECMPPNTSRRKTG